MRLPTVKMTALLATVGVSVAAIGTAQATVIGSTTSPTTTAPPTTGPAPTTTGAPVTTTAGSTVPGADATTTVPGATTTTTGATLAGALPANASLTEIQAAVASMIGDTTDVPGELSPFVTPPPGILTPEGARVLDFNLWLYPDESPDSSYYSASITFFATPPAAELVPFYQNGMPAAGFVQTGDSVSNENDRQIRWLTYDVPAPISTQDEIEIAIVDDPSQDFLQMDITYGLDPTAVQIFGGWAASVPLVATGVIDGGSVTTFNFGGDVTLNLDADYSLPVPVADAQAQFEAALVGTPYTVDPSSDIPEGIYYLTGGEIPEITVLLNEGYPEGTTSMSVSGSLDITI